MNEKIIYLILGINGSLATNFLQLLKSKNCNTLLITHCEKGTYEKDSIIFSDYNITNLGPIIVEKCKEFSSINILYALGGNFGYRDGISSDLEALKILRVNFLIPIAVYKYLNIKFSRKSKLTSIFLSSGVVKQRDSSMLYAASKLALENSLYYLKKEISENANLHCIRLPGINVPNKKWHKLMLENPKEYLSALSKYNMTDALEQDEVSSIIFDYFNKSYNSKYKVKLWEY